MATSGSPVASSGASAASTAQRLEILDLTVADRSAGLPVQGLSVGVGPGEVVAVLADATATLAALAQTVLGLGGSAFRRTGGRVVFGGADVTGSGREDSRGPRALRGTRVGYVGPGYARADDGSEEVPSAPGSIGALLDPPTTARRRIPAIDPTLRTGALIDELLRQHTRLGSAERRARTLGALGEWGFVDPEMVSATVPGRLSLAERQRVAFAMATALEPAVVVADEPTAVLDPIEQAQLLALLVERRRRTGFLWLTRDASLALEVADRIAIVREGEVVEIGSCEELLVRPRHAHTRELLATRPTLAVPERPVDPHALVVAQVRDLECRRRRHTPIEDISFDLRRGQITGLVGGAGSGKSTVARCLVRQLAPQGGSIVLGTDEIANLSSFHLQPMRRRVQLIVPDPGGALDPRRSIEQGMVDGPLNFGIPREAAHDRAVDLLGLVQLERSALGRYPHEFTPAQLLRIALARALMVEPEILVLDDVTAPFDTFTQAALLRQIDDIRLRLPVAMLLLTRDLRHAAAVCDSIGVMSDGRIVEMGPARTVVTQPRHAATRALIAAAGGPPPAAA